MWAVEAQPRTGLTPMIPTPSVDSHMVVRSDLPTAQLARCASTSISRSTFLPTRKPPASTAMFQVIPQSSRSIVVFADAANIGFPFHVRPPPEELPREGDRP